MNITDTYYDSLIAHIIANVPDVNGQKITEDDWMGTIEIDAGDSTLYATPGWEGEALPFGMIVDDTGSVTSHGNLDVTWTGDLEADTALWVEKVTALINLGLVIP